MHLSVQDIGYNIWYIQIYRCVNNLSKKHPRESFVFGIGIENFKVTESFSEYSSGKLPCTRKIITFNEDCLSSEISETFRTETIILAFKKEKSLSLNLKKSANLFSEKVNYKLIN